MKHIIFTLVIAVLASCTSSAAPELSGIYSFDCTRIDGQNESLSKYKDKHVLIVNVASQCGLTPHYKGLQEMYATHKANGLVVLGFPANNFGKQEPGSDSEIKEFCDIQYKITFPMFSKISVKGPDIHPLYKYLTTQKGFEGDIKWNFTKFLIGPDGHILKRYHHKTKPADIEKDIAEYLK